MEFNFTKEQSDLRDETIRFARRELAGEVRRDKSDAFSRERWKKCAEFGIQGMSFPAACDGKGQDVVTTVAVFEALGYACHDSELGFGLGAQMWGVQKAIEEFGSDEQKRRFLAPLCRGEWIAAHAMSESRATNTRVVREGDDSILTGHTTLVSIAPDADLFLIFAIRAERDPMTSSAFIIERESPGVRVTPNAGPRAKQSVQVEFESCRLSAAHRLGPDGGAATILESSMDWQRACILAPCVGAMRRQLEACVEHARTHEEFGQPVGKRQSVASCLVDMRMRWETARSLLYRAAWSKQGGGRAPLESAVAKLYIGESWVKNCLDAIQVYGTGGHPIEYQLEHDLRDAVDGTLYSGTSEMQRDVIARRLGL